MTAVDRDRTGNPGLRDPDFPSGTVAPAESELKRLNALLGRAEELAGSGSWEWCPDNGELLWSDNLYRIYGFEPGEITPTLEAVFDLAHPEDRERVIESTRVLPRTGKLPPLDFRIVRADGSVRRLRSIVATETNGNLPAIHYGTIEDRTDRLHAEADAVLRAQLLDTINAAIIVTDLEGTVAHWNPGAERLFGWSAEETVGHSVMGLTVNPDDTDRAEEIMAAVARDGRWQGEFEVRRKDGASVPAIVQHILLSDVDGHPTGVLAITVDLSERIEIEERLRRAHEHLKAITDAIGDGVATVDRDGRLTYLNPAGERLLGWRQEELAGRVLHDAIHFRRPDGSDYPIEECPLRGPRTGADTVHVDDDHFIRRDGTNLRVEYTSSPFETADGIGGAVVIFSDIAARKAREEELERRVESLSWLGRVRDALRKDRFLVHAQPIVDVGSGEVVRHELLVRMQGEDGSVVAPGCFLPVAEEYSMIAEIDRWMIGEATRLAGRGHAVSLNLSAQTIACPDVGAWLRDALGSAGADPSLVVVELTETALLENKHEAARFVDAISELGCQFALDDFGSGYGGFTYLKRFSVDYLKIDTEFVRDLCTNSASEHVVKAVVNLADGFGHRVIAEGVEDQPTLEALREIGVSFAQGYFLASPGPLEATLGGDAGA